MVGAFRSKAQVPISPFMQMHPQSQGALLSMRTMVLLLLKQLLIDSLKSWLGRGHLRILKEIRDLCLGSPSLSSL
jgi:hypothetical protein